MEKQSKKKRRKKGNIIKNIIVFFIFECVFTAILMPFYTMYGPFIKVRNWMVATSMATGKHQFIAKTFFNDDNIKTILDEENRKLNDNSNLAVDKKVEVSYTDGIAIQDVGDGNRFDGKAILIKDPTKVKVGYSSKLGVSGEMVSDMAARYNALAAINGGGFNDTTSDGKTGGTGGVPTGIVISNGQVVYPKDKGEYDQKQMVFSIDTQGNMYVGSASVNDLIEKRAQQAISFYPSLVVDGKPYISESNLVGQNPRTAIGQRADKSIILLVIDGRKGMKLGATLKDLQNIMLNLGAVNAMGLDGGGSSVMYYNNQIINNPSNIGGERAMPDFIYVER